MLTRADQAKLIQLLVNVTEGLTQMLDILVPDDESPENCPHPPSAIEHEETMDDEQTPWHCTRCGATQDQPFHRS